MIISTPSGMGNASFRCERGFPSFRHDGLIYVSRRNVDKRFIGPEAFVAVQTNSPLLDLEYFGENKPSVDAPVQLALYEMYPEVRFMLHSHTYIDGAPFTKDILPCGALEEAGQIYQVRPHSPSDLAVDFAVNIRGHGSICLASSPEFFRGVHWVARPMPEIVCPNV